MAFCEKLTEFREGIERSKANETASVRFGGSSGHDASVALNANAPLFRV